MIDPATLLDRLGVEWSPRGTKLVAPCPHPDHDDRRPSWAAWEDHLGRFRHRCLSCGWGGGPANLVMALLGCDRRAAHDFLLGAEQAGPPPPLHVRVEVRDESPSTFDLVPEEVWFDEDWPTPPRRYLRDRGLGHGTVERWGLGYAVDGDLGGRIWIPVKSIDGALESWTARAYDDRDPKYDSSTRPAHGVLLGEHLWPGLHSPSCVVVEGPFDAMAVDALGLGVAVAALRGSVAGKALDPEHARKLARFEEVVVATDPDEAGRKAADRLLGLRRWTRVRLVEFEPFDEDCAGIFARSPAELARRLALGPQ